MSTSAVVPQKRFPWLRTWLRIQQILVFVGLVVYAILVSLNQKPPLLAMMATVLTMGNLLAPVAFAARRIYADRPFPWNWVLFAPVQLAFAFLCAVGTVIFLQITRIDPESFRIAFARSGYLAVVLFLVVSVSSFVIEQFSRRLRERNELLEQMVEKGTLVLQQQEEELKRAGEIQQMLLPSSLPQLNGAQISGAWQPAREVGGDYFDVIPFNDHRVGICVGDVAGKGITAVLLMANLQASFRAFATADASPGLVCTKLNKFLCANTAAGKFVTFLYGVVDLDRRTLVYENAGHCPGLLLRENGEREALRVAERCWGRSRTGVIATTWSNFVPATSSCFRPTASPKRRTRTWKSLAKSAWYLRLAPRMERHWIRNAPSCSGLPPSAAETSATTQPFWCCGSYNPNS